MCFNRLLTKSAHRSELLVVSVGRGWNGVTGWRVSETSQRHGQVESMVCDQGEPLSWMTSAIVWRGERCPIPGLLCPSSRNAWMNTYRDMWRKLDSYSAAQQPYHHSRLGICCCSWWWSSSSSIMSLPVKTREIIYSWIVTAICYESIISKLCLGSKCRICSLKQLYIWIHTAFYICG